MTEYATEIKVTIKDGDTNLFRKEIVYCLKGCYLPQESEVKVLLDAVYNEFQGDCDDCDVVITTKTVLVQYAPSA